MAAKKSPSIRPIPFGERPGDEHYNASAIVAIDDSRMLFCDNNIGDALFELRLAPDGTMAGPLIRRPLRGLEPETVDDLEGMTQVWSAAGRFLVAVPSLSLKARKRRRKRKSRRGKESAARGCLVKITAGDDETLDAAAMPGFREWVVEHVPSLHKASRRLPDDGGLNVEGLAWSPAEQALLLGVRTPLIDGRPLVLRVRLQEIDGPWNLSNFAMLPPVSLRIRDDQGEQGVRAITFDPSRQAWLIVVGNSTSKSKAPFALYAWDGNANGDVRCFEHVRFHKSMRVEGATFARIGGRDAIVFADDGGGYQVLWDDDPRLT